MRRNGTGAKLHEKITIVIVALRSRILHSMSFNGVKIAVCLDTLYVGDIESNAFYQIEMELIYGEEKMFSDIVTVLARHMNIPEGSSATDKPEAIMKTMSSGFKNI